MSPGGQNGECYLVVESHHIDPAGVVENQVSVTIWQDPLDTGGVDSLFPAAADHLPPAGWRRPLSVDVRFVQDTTSFARHADLRDSTEERAARSS
jgi:hypothetical protein